MFSTSRSVGFYHLPVSKVFVSSVIVTSLAVSLPLHHVRHLFVYTYQDIFDKLELWRLITSKLVFLDPKDLVCGAILIFYWRIFERKLGSQKYCSYLLATGFLASLLELAALYCCKKAELDLDSLPTGPLSFLFPLFVPFFCDIPRVAVTNILGIPVTGKTFTYILGFQIASTSIESVLVAGCGLISGLLYKANFLKIKDWFHVPNFVAGIADKTLGRLVKTETVQQINTPLGATLELQRQQEIELLEEQLARQQFRQMRNMGGMAFQPRGAGIFGNLFDGGAQPRQGHNQPAPAVQEEQVQTLVEMGFVRENVIEALRATNNDVSMATNVLLHNS
ncbi:ubiquitin-associated domain-containing protein 2 [Lingula anatina]|uniref:Ubiquitin-associated domain-containing protein 2 n=1 Tax=Lingula anatina TaxID=7574 RepID=A0A1S3JXZ0_LINAN|nr:ubiquitin-associated domain-containing protein 2 [Lingula anatina]|eukprot:XP_013415280.1 ubiquitin-associated domain-containing protein 2 [Lingula anatina]